MIRIPKFEPGQSVKLALVPEDYESIDFGMSAFPPYADKFKRREFDTYQFIGYIEHREEHCVITNPKNNCDFIVLDSNIRALTHDEWMDDPS